MGILKVALCTLKWLSRDTIGITGGINLYGYVNESPMLFSDPLGIDAIIYKSDGSSIDVTTGQDFINTINGLAAGSIDRIIVTGHARVDQQSFDASDSSNSNGFYYDDNTVWVVDNTKPVANQLVKLGDLLKGKFDPKGSKLLSLTGCHSGEGDDNIAKASSSAIPGISVLGNPGYVVGYRLFPNFIGFPIAPFFWQPDRIYVNGKIK